MVPSRCARHELVVLFLQVFEAGTALDRLKSFKQSDQESIAPYVARFIQRAKFLPEELPVSEKFKIIKRNIRPYYQTKYGTMKSIPSIDFSICATASARPS
jgi:hypothetical protein